MEVIYNDKFTIDDFNEMLELLDSEIRDEPPKILFILPVDADERSKILSKWDEEFKLAAEEYIKQYKLC